MIGKIAHHTLQRMRASRSGQSELGRPWGLARTADGVVKHYAYTPGTAWRVLSSPAAVMDCRGRSDSPKRQLQP